MIILIKTELINHLRHKTQGMNIKNRTKREKIKKLMKTKKQAKYVRD